jgi:hypothetical protein
MYLRQFEVLRLSLASKLGFHPVAIAHLSPGTGSLVVSQIPTGVTRDVGRDSTSVIHFHPMLYTCIMDKRNYFNLIIVQN